ncbi:MAG TPA: hypothetical protein VK911_17760 [Vicinamibacterales bacterium]|nr:hypothetical protein [Vicinamibacterales bacterium]
MRKLPDAHVAEDGPHGFKVHPPVAAVWRDEGFHFHNVTNQLVTLQFPQGVLAADDRLASSAGLRELFPEAVAALLVYAVRWVGPDETIHLPFTTRPPRVVRYGVTVHTEKGPVDAPGGSAPKIIIEP